MNENNSWFKVVAPHFDNIVIGEIYGNSENVVGRKIAYGASELKEIKPRVGYKLIFRIVSVSESECKAELDSLILSREQISRLVRHSVSKMDVVVPVTIEDKPYAIKILCAISKTQNKYKKAIKVEIKNFIEGEVKESKLKDVFIGAMTNKTQNGLHKKLNKIYPTRIAEVRAIEPRKL
jgi:ribosomal protein S3AE